MSLSRRGFINGLITTLAAPAVVKAEILMPVKKIIKSTSFIIEPTAFKTVDVVIANAVYSYDISKWIVIDCKLIKPLHTNIAGL